MRRKLAAGNWKMNGTSAALSEIEALAKAHKGALSEILICPAATLLERAARVMKDTALTLGAQDCHPETRGAHTGDLSADMLLDAGASHVILGHSERRADHGEADSMICAKARAAMASGLKTIICVGEALHEREARSTLDVIGAQLDGSIPEDAAETLVVAYEPIWAIGTGKVPVVGEISQVHEFMRARLEARFGATFARGVRLLYGGSVKPSNAAGIFAVNNVDGALVGGASLKAEDFSPIIAALDAS